MQFTEDENQNTLFEQFESLLSNRGQDTPSFPELESVPQSDPFSAEDSTPQESSFDGLFDDLLEEGDSLQGLEDPFTLIPESEPESFTDLGSHEEQLFPQEEDYREPVNDFPQFSEPPAPVESFPQFSEPPLPVQGFPSVGGSLPPEGDGLSGGEVQVSITVNLTSSHDLADEIASQIEPQIRDIVEEVKRYSSDSVAYAAEAISRQEGAYR